MTPVTPDACKEKHGNLHWWIGVTMVPLIVVFGGIVVTALGMANTALNDGRVHKAQGDVQYKHIIERLDSIKADIKEFKEK